MIKACHTIGNRVSILITEVRRVVQKEAPSIYSKININIADLMWQMRSTTGIDRIEKFT